MRRQAWAQGTVLRRSLRVSAWLLATLLLLGVAAALAAWLTLRASLPRLDGDVTAPPLMAAANIERDANGNVTVTASNRLDMAYATGYAQAQDRFFQMDLLRRVAAGEVSELVGADALPLDRRHRLHRFRARAVAAYAAMPQDQRVLLQKYSQGVNDGLGSLQVRPFEYLLLGTAPRAWQPEDTLLVIDAMYLDLQSNEISRVLARGALRRILAPDLLAFLTPPSSAGDAPLDNKAIAVPPLAVPRARPQWLERPTPVAIAPLAGWTDVGSNSFAVAAAHSQDGHAMVANDMHLGLALPNIWYRLTLNLAGTRRISGVSLPGAPVVVAGSNGDVAWTFTSSYGHFIDLVVLERDAADPRRYRDSAGNWREAAEHDEQILVKGGAPVTLRVFDTLWGPILDTAGQSYAVRWIAYQPDAADLGLLRLEQARNVPEALHVAQTAGVPTQNFVVADSAGHIGWTLAGPLWARALDPAGYPVPAAQVQAPAAAQGRLPSQDYPQVVDPPLGRLWTANNTQLGDTELQARIGDGGADFGARASQLRDDLLKQDRFDAKAMLNIQLDDRALWLGFWRTLALQVLDDDAVADEPQRAAFKRVLTQWNGRADIDAAGYTLVRDFRQVLYAAWFSGLDEQLAADAPDLASELSVGRASSRLEPVMQALVREHAWVPARYRNWRDFMLAAIDVVVARNTAAGARLEDARWGDQNRLAVRHPFARLLPRALRGWLSAPSQPMPGDTNMPRVQRPAVGASERFVVAPGQEGAGIMEMPGGASGHPLSPYFLAGHQDWVEGKAAPFLPGPAAHRLVLGPAQGQAQGQARGQAVEPAPDATDRRRSGDTR